MADRWRELKRTPFWFPILFLVAFTLFCLPVVRYLFILSYRATPNGAIAYVGAALGFACMLLAGRSLVRSARRHREARKQGMHSTIGWATRLALVLAIQLMLSAGIAIALETRLGQEMVTDQALAAIRRATLWFLPYPWER